LSRLTLALGLSLLAVETAVAVAIVATSDHADKGPTIALAVTAGVAFVLSGLVALWRRPENRTGVFMATVGYTWLLGALGESNSSWVFSIGYALGSLAFAPFSALLLVHPTGRFESRLERAVPWLVGGALIGLSTAKLLVDPTPAASCDGCPPNAFDVVDAPRLADALDALESVVAVGLAVLLVGLLARRWRRAAPALRRLLWPVLVTGGAAIVILVVDSVVTAVASADASDRIAPLFFVTFAAVPAAFLFGVLRTKLAQSSATDVMAALESGTPLQEALVGALGDPTLEIAYWSPERDAWVDAEGRRRDEPGSAPGRSVTMVERDAQRVAAIVHDSALDGEPQLVESVAAAAGMSLQNERLKAELHAQYAFLETVANTAPSLLVVVGTDGRIQNQNAATVVASGYDDEEQVRGQYFWDVFIDPREREAMIARFEAAAPDFPPAEYENWFTNAKGEELVIDWRSAPVHDENGEVVSIVAGGIDATERHRHAAELEREREFLNAIANNAPSLLCLIDAEGRVAHLATNKAFEHTLEYKPEETGGHVFWERYVDPADATEVREAIEHVVAGEAVPEHDHHWLTRSGRRLLIAWTCTALPALDERRLFLISGVDVTERKRREAEVHAERDFLSAVANSIPSLLALLEPDGTVAGRGVNRAFTDLMGYDDDDLIGRPLWDVLSPEDEREDAATALRQALTPGRPSSGEGRWHTRDGDVRFVEWTVIPTVDAEGRLQYLVSATDVTEREKRQRELQWERDYANILTDTNPSLIAVIERDGTFPENALNPAFETTLQRTESEIVGASFLDLLHPEDAESAKIAVAVAASGGQSEQIESRWLRRDGQEVVVVWSATAIPGFEGQTLVLVSGLNITDRKARELEAERRRDFLNAITDAVPSFLAVVDLEGAVIERGVNRAFSDAFGWAASDIAGCSFLDVMAQEDEHAARMAIANAANGVFQPERETRWLRRDGDTRLVAWTAWPVMDHLGRSLVLVSGHDVTVRRSQEEEIRASRARLVEAADNARRKLERNLHDGAQQRLVALSVSLRLAESKLAVDPAGAASILAASRVELTQALDELRELARGIHPAVLTDRGLGAAVDALVARSPVPVEAEVCSTPLQPAVEAAAYYVVSESLANVVKYAQASSVTVRISAENGHVLVEVADDGVGGADPGGGSGLRGLSDRLAALDGTLHVVSPMGSGTLVRAVIPVRPAAPAT
jgi:PAS domain S-box-containing protein